LIPRSGKEANMRQSGNIILITGGGTEIGRRS